MFLGGALGAALRFAFQSRVQSPYIALIVVNIAGSFALGWLAATRFGRNRVVSALVITGLLGGFTTYSAFTFAVIRGVAAGNWLGTTVFALVSVAGGVAAAVLGSRLVRA